MKKVLMCLTLIIFSIGFVNAFTTGFSDRTGIIVKEIKYEPFPAVPGRYLDVWFKVENFGGVDANNFVIELTPKFPFSLDPDEDAIKRFGRILAHQTVLVKYKVRIDENAIEGDNALRFRFRHDSGDRWRDGQITIFIRTADANIAVSAVKTDRIAPGEVSPVEIELENLADSTLSDINIKLDIAGTATPFVPINSTSEKKIYNIKPGNKESVIFNLMALPKADSDAYKVPIEITFKDGTGQNYTKSSIIGLVIGTVPDISVVIDNSEIYKTQSTGGITLRIVNKGLSDIKLMNVVLRSSPDYEIISSKEFYVGNIDSDDFETAEFRVKIKKSRKGKTFLHLDLEYLDANNVRYKESESIALNIVSAKKLGIKKGSPLNRLLIIIVIIVAGYFSYKMWEKKREKKHGKK